MRKYTKWVGLPAVLLLTGPIGCENDTLFDFLFPPLLEELPALECATTALACDDGFFCNGQERCVNGICETGVPPCAGAMCDEQANACAGTCDPNVCDDGKFCNGEERCEFTDDAPSGFCASGALPCAADEVCIESRRVCVECEFASDCPAGNQCVDDFCEPASDEPTSVTVFLRNEDILTTHILTASESFGAANRLAPGGSRTVTLPPSLAGDVFTFRAGRNGTVFATVDCTLAPDSLEDAVVTWTGFDLTCSGDLFE